MDVLPLLDELRAMAQTGLHYADDPYDRQRYERILELVAEYYGEAFDLPPEEVRDRLEGELGEVTPKVAAVAGIVDDEGRVLVIDRAGGGGWCLPGGKLDVGESPEEAVVREVREETGLEVEPRDLVGTYTREPPAEYPHHSVIFCYDCDVVGGELATTVEADDAAYFAVDEVPEWWAADYHPDLARDVLAARDGE